MDWSAIGAIGQIIGVVVVIVSIAYLAKQVRQANQHAAAAAESDWMKAWNEILNSWVTDETTIEAIRCGFESFETLTKSQKSIFHMRIGTMVNHWVLTGQLVEKGLMSSKIYDGCTDVVISVLATPGGRQYWSQIADATPGGIELLERLNQNENRLPPITTLMPWWSENDV